MEGVELRSGETLLRIRPGKVSSLRLSDLFRGATLFPGVTVVRVDPISGAAEAAIYLHEWLPNFWIRSGEWIIVDSSGPVTLERNDIDANRISLSGSSDTLELVPRDRTRVGWLAYVGIFDAAPEEGTVVIVSEESETTLFSPRPPVNAEDEIEMGRPNQRAFRLEGGLWVSITNSQGAGSTSAQLAEWDRVWIYRPNDVGTQPTEAEPNIVIKRNGSQIVIEYVGILLGAPEIWGPYEEVEGASSPFTVDAKRSARFYVAE